MTRIPGTCPKCGCEQLIERWVDEYGEERAEWLCCIDPKTGDANDCNGKDTEVWDFF